MAMRSMFNSYLQQGGGRLPTAQPAFTAEQDRFFSEQRRKQIEANPDAFLGVESNGRPLDPPTQTIDGAFGGMLPSVSMPVSAPIDYSQGGNGYIGVQGGFDDFGNIHGSGAANAAREQYYSNTGFDTTLPTQAPVSTTGLNLTNLPSAPSAPSAGEVAGGAALAGLLSGGIDLQNVLGTAGQAYLGEQAVSAPYEIGRAGLELAEQVGQRGVEATEFKPYTVTSNLARVGIDPSGGFTTQLSPEQQALQQQIMGQAGGFFSQLQADPAAVQADIYESIRATQRPEEERQRLALEERMLSQGRLGLSSAAYGGASPELLAQETARQEAMARANLGARQQALAEQQQAAGIAGGLLSTGYMPQQQALALLEASRIPAQLQQRGQLAGAELQSQLGGLGIESLLQGTQLSQEAQLAMNQSLMQALAGRQGLAGEFTGGLLGGIVQPAVEALPSWLSGLFSSRPDYDAMSDEEREQAMYDIFN